MYSTVVNILFVLLRGGGGKYSEALIIMLQDRTYQSI